MGEKKAKLTRERLTRRFRCYGSGAWRYEDSEIRPRAIPIARGTTGVARWNSDGA